MLVTGLAALLTVAAVPACSALQNGLGRTPAMGWNPYNAFSCNTDETQYHTALSAFVDLGFAELGYKYFNLDCGWQGTARTANGTFTWNATRFPAGIPALASAVHQQGLLFGVYSDAGFFSCDFVGGTAGWLGSLTHERADANAFTSWGADYLKYDNCYAVNKTDFVDMNPPISLEPHYTAMRDALNATGRPVLFSICEWGVQDPARWAPLVGNSWRIANDIGPPASWDNLFRIINQLVPIAPLAGPGAFNDLDLLEVGNQGLTLDEQRTHFAFWAAAKSPLIVSTDLTMASSETLGILQNPRIIDLNQDALGQSIVFKRRYTNDHDVWAGPLADGSTLAFILNWMNATNSLSFDLTDVGFASAQVMNVTSGQSLGDATGSLSVVIPAHGSLVLKLTGTTPATPRTFTYYPAASSSSVYAGGARNNTVNATLTSVGWIGDGAGTLTMTGIDGGTSGGTKLLSIDYINGDYTFTNTDCSNCRNAYVSVNGGTAVQVQMPISGQSWDLVFQGYLLSLGGFKAGKVNKMTFSNPNAAWAPDFYRVGVAA